MKLKELGIKLDDTIKKRLGSPESIQIITKILNRIQIETRKKIKKTYSNLLIQLLKEDPKINFDQKLVLFTRLEKLKIDIH